MQVNPGARHGAVLLLGLLLVGWFSAFGYALWKLRAETLEHGLETAEIHARNFEESISQTLQSIVLVAAGFDLADAAPQQRLELERRLIDALRPTPSLRSIAVLDAQGRIVASSSPQALGQVVDLASFYPPAEADANVLRIGPPWLGRDLASARPLGSASARDAREPLMLPVLHRLPASSQPLYLLTALNPDYFINHASHLIPLDRGRVQWLRYDDLLLMSSAPADALGTPHSAGQVAERLLVSEHGALTQQLPGGPLVLTAYRASARYPVLVAVHMERQALLADWQRHAERLAATMAPVLLALTGAALLIVRRQKWHEQRRLAASVFEGSSDAIAIITPQAEMLSVNAAFERLSGYSQPEIRGRSLMLLAPPSPAGPEFRLMWDALRQNGHWLGELALAGKDGQVRRVSLTIDEVRNERGHLNHYAGVLVDITERKAVEDRLQLAASVFNHAREGIIITTPDARVIDVNEAFTQITGYSREEVLGHTPHLLSSGKHDRDFYAAMWRHLKAEGFWTGEIWNRRRSGEIFVQLLTISAVRDRLGRVLHYVGLFSDISQQKAHEFQLERIAHYDALTSLPNRILLADRLRQAMVTDRRRNQKLALVFLDLDGFKAVNDTHGHAMGDKLLVALSQRMSQGLRAGDTLARLGGDEFVAVLIDLVDEGAAVPVLERLRVAAAQPVVVGGQELRVSASMGVTYYPQPDAVDAEQLLRQADRAMYQAKLSGKNCVHYFNAAEDRDIRGHQETVDAIQRGLAQNEFELFYQPKVNMRSGQLIGVEALLRWRRPDKGLVLPDEFLPALRGHAQALVMGQWVLDTALAQIEAWKALGLEIPISVNIEAQQLRQADFVERLQALLRAHPGVCARDLELELLETSTLDDVGQVARVMEACRGLGIPFALDDFGSGYASLAYLRRLPAAVLKIDRSFVKDLLEDPEDLTILQGMLGLATSFGKDIVAEGVETLDLGHLLLCLGCELAQGYAIARPMPADDVPAWLAQWRPDPSWSERLPVAREDLPAIAALIEHRAWIKDIAALLRGAHDAARAVDAHPCRFGHWLDLEGARLAQQHPAALQDFQDAHQALHQRAQAVLALSPPERLAQSAAAIVELQQGVQQLAAALMRMV